MKTSAKITPLLVALVLLLCHNYTFSQVFPSNIEWQKCYGWTSWYGDEGTKIIKANDGNYISIGKRTTQGFEMAWISKQNSNGELIWETTVYDDKSYTGFRAMDFVQNEDGSILLLCRISNYQKLRFNYTNGRDVISTQAKGGNDVLLVKLNNVGRMEWFKTYGGEAQDSPAKIVKINNGQYLIAANVFSGDGDMANSGKVVTSYNQDIWIAKVDNSGNILSKKCLGGNGNETIVDIKQSIDGNYVLCGSSTSNDNGILQNKGSKDILIAKFDNSLNFLWNKTYGGSQNDESEKLICKPNGEIILGITSNSFDNDFAFTSTEAFPFNYEDNIWLFKTNNNGDILQKKIIGGSGRDNINDLTTSLDGNLILVGSTRSNNGDIKDKNRIPGNNNGRFDALLMKISNSFQIIWQKTLGGSDDDEGNGVYENTDESLVLIGTTKSFDGDVKGNHYSGQDNRDIWLVKLNFPCEKIVNTSKDLVAITSNVLASETINTSDRVSSKSLIKYGANKNIDLAPGFDTEQGSMLDFVLQGCTASNSTAVNNKPIQLKINTACREGGAKFKFMPFTPNTDLSQYHISVQNLNPSIEYNFSGNSLLTKNNRPDTGNAYYLVTVSKAGYEDFTYQGYMSTCDHDNAPLDCPENYNDLVLDKEYYQIGEKFTAKWTGTLLPDQGLDCYPSNVSEIRVNGTTIEGRIIDFPANIHVQPGQLINGYRPCHGATEVHFRAVK